MPERLILFDALRSLAQGHPMIEMPGDPCPSFGRHLEGVPHIHIVAPRLKAEGWVREIDSPNAMRHWVITPKGRAEFERGREWYRSLSFGQLVFGRLGLPYDEPLSEVLARWGLIRQTRGAGLAEYACLACVLVATIPAAVVPVLDAARDTYDRAAIELSALPLMDPQAQPGGPGATFNPGSVASAPGAAPASGTDNTPALDSTPARTAPEEEESTASVPPPPAAKGNASANNGKGGNYNWTGHTDNGKGNGRNRK